VPSWKKHRRQAGSYDPGTQRYTQRLRTRPDQQRFC